MSHRTKVVIYAILVLGIAYFTYFRNYSYPANLFWDENYHIASAYKYLNGVFFMEPHPPLGKLLIALGEKIIHPNTNINTASFLTTDYIKTIPVGFSFIGVRFFPVLFATLSSVVFFFILYTLSGYGFLSFLFTFFYLFENSFIVHSRGAMLEPIQIFFVLALLLQTFKSIKRYTVTKLVMSNVKRQTINDTSIDSAYRITVKDYIIAGILFGLALSVKLNSVIFGFVFIIMLAGEIYYSQFTNANIIQYVFKGFFFMSSALVIFIGIYGIHVFLASSPREQRFYEASNQYKKILDAKSKTLEVKNIPFMLKEHLTFILHYEKGVPKYDVCKEGENGSLPITWPFMSKGINYRWESKEGSIKYLYLHGNPVVWFFGLFGIFFSINLLVSYLFFHTKIKNKHLFFSIISLLLLYILYMGWVMSIARVMYLYHYFLPLLISLMLGFLMFLYLHEDKLNKDKTKIYLQVIFLILIIVMLYLFFSPLTYYLPLTGTQFDLRNWFPFWGLKKV